MISSSINGTRIQDAIIVINLYAPYYSFKIEKKITWQKQKKTQKVVSTVLAEDLSTSLSGFKNTHSKSGKQKYANNTINNFDETELFSQNTDDINVYMCLCLCVYIYILCVCIYIYMCMHVSYRDTYIQIDIYIF